MKINVKQWLSRIVNKSHQYDATMVMGNKVRGMNFGETFQEYADEWDKDLDELTTQDKQIAILNKIVEIFGEKEDNDEKDDQQNIRVY